MQPVSTACPALTAHQPPAITLSHALSYHREVNDLPHIAQPVGMKPCLNPEAGLPGSALAVSQNSSGLSPEKMKQVLGPACKC